MERLQDATGFAETGLTLPHYEEGFKDGYVSGSLWAGGYAEALLVGLGKGLERGGYSGALEVVGKAVEQFRAVLAERLEAVALGDIEIVKPKTEPVPFP